MAKKKSAKSRAKKTARPPARRKTAASPTRRRKSIHSPPSSRAPEAKIPPLDEPIGEAPGHLRAREEAFKRRRGVTH